MIGARSSTEPRANGRVERLDAIHVFALPLLLCGRSLQRNTSYDHLLCVAHWVWKLLVFLRQTVTEML
jgi:hypothetical protein